MAALLTMLRPMTATLRPFLAAAFTICWMRAMSDANVANITRPGASAMIRSRFGSSTASEGVYPSDSA